MATMWQALAVTLRFGHRRRAPPSKRKPRPDVSGRGQNCRTKALDQSVGVLPEMKLPVLVVRLDAPSSMAV